MNIIEFNFTNVSGAFSWIVDIIDWLVSNTTIVVGVILFTVILKLITLPFDYSSKKTMKKNAIKMEEMRPDLEKLQRQYADNKELYNQKMMALYKKNGYSVFGSCLPIILSLVIFIVAIGAFNDYSQYKNREYFYDMSCAYNQVIYEGLEADNDYVKFENNSLTIKDTEILEKVKNNDKKINSNGVIYNIGLGSTNDYFYIYSTKSYIKYIRYFNVDTNALGQTRLEIFEEGLTKKFALGYSIKNYEGKTYTEVKDNYTDNGVSFLQDVCQTAAANTFKNNDSSFYWIKNIWVSDSAFSHPVEKDWDTFKNAQEYVDNSASSNMTSDTYKQLIAKLTDYTEAPNGYFVLVLLTAGLSLLLQLITTKSQKAQMELQTVDGQGMQTQKVMNIMMPIMMGVFSFMYTAAFSIYIIVSNVISIGSTLLINKIVETKYGNANNTKSDVIRGRVYEKKQEEVKKPEKKKQEEIVKNDFLSGYADKKGRK